MLVLSSTCEIIVSDGTNEVYAAPNKALHQWSQGKRLFWSREPRDGEYIWKRTTCIQCHMNPLIGPRHGCTNVGCKVDLCETCLPTNKHEHPLVEYLLPKQDYSLEQLFKYVPYLLNPNNEEKIETKTIWQDGVKTVGFYFSAHSYEPCHAFTPKLTEFYKELQESFHSLRIVFVSSDRDEKSFNEYRSTMPWPAVPFNSGGTLKVYFQSDSECFFNL